MVMCRTCGFHKALSKSGGVSVEKENGGLGPFSVDVCAIASAVIRFPHSCVAFAMSTFPPPVVLMRVRMFTGVKPGILNKGGVMLFGRRKPKKRGCDGGCPCRENSATRKMLFTDAKFLGRGFPRS